MSPTKRPKAYSYLRFSTPEQMKGDSMRRQLALATAYAERHGLDLSTDTYHDLGVSAYQSRNAKAGQLGLFLQACEQGAVEPGSYLLVENLDRISRANPLKAASTLQAICAEGVTVVTLNDNHEYTAKSLETDISSVLMSILTFARAHQESETKSKRLKAVWENKRANAGKAFKTTSVCPEWLRAVKDAHGKVVRHEEIPERVRIIKGIFRDYASGVGVMRIASALNEKGKPTFGGGKMWHRSYIRKILDNPAVIGTYRSYVHEYKDGKRVAKLEREVKGYFPRIVEPKVYEAVQALKDGGNDPRRGRHAGQPLRSIFAGLARCPKCGGTMQHVNKGAPPKGGRYFVCGAARMKRGCVWNSVRAQTAEQALDEHFAELLTKVPRVDPQGRKVAERLDRIEADMEGTTTAIENMLEVMQRGGERSASAVARLQELEASLQALQREERELLGWQAAHSRVQSEGRAKALAAALREEPRDLVKANALMRQTFTGVVMDYEAGKLRFQWQHGGETSIRFAWSE